MRKRLLLSHSSPVLILLSVLLVSVFLSPTPLLAQTVLDQSSLPVVGVWSTQYASSNVTDVGLGVDSIVTFEVNVTGAPSFNAYEFFLYHDPNILQALSIDETTGTIFNNPFVVVQELVPEGTVHLAVVNLGGVASSSDGVLVHINFKVLSQAVTPLTLAAGMAQHSSAAGSWTTLFFGANPIGVVTSDGYFKNEPSKLGPVAAFTFAPSSPEAGDSVLFDAADSYDADNATEANKGIREYRWDFGDGLSLSTNASSVTHVFASRTGVPFSGNFSVRLTVVDSEGFAGMKTMRIGVSEPMFHDVSISSLTATPSTVARGENVTISVTVANRGTFSETFNLNVTIDPFRLPRVFGNITGETIAPRQSRFYNFVLATSLLDPGVYEVAARVSVAVDDAPGNNMAVITLNVQGANTPPVASFTFNPPRPVAGDFVNFDGSSSFDPDGFIATWSWDFGDGGFGFGIFTGHSYFVAGNYTVTLTVTDNNGATGRTNQIVSVRSRPSHDVTIEYIDAYPRVAVSSQFVSVTVVLRNNGLLDETVDLTVYYDSHVIETETGILLRPGYYSYYETVVWDTLGVSPGNYTISAIVTLESDEFPSDNSRVDGIVTILPAPVMEADPGAGPLGTKVVVTGSGFPATPYGLGLVLVTFDDMFMGYAIRTDGEFSFTFNIPHAEPGMHQIKALDVFSGARALASFQVLLGPEPGLSLDVSIDMGVVYFPGDTVDIYLLVSSRGVPVSSADLRLELVLVKPDGSTVSLSVSPAASGLFKASYSVPRTGSLGTYALTATASLGDSHGSALRSFEVKPTWIAAQGPRIFSAAAVVGVVAAVAVAYRRGVFGRKDEPQPSAAFPE